MVSLDDDSSFTNIPLDGTMGVWIVNLYNGSKNPPNILKHDFLNLLKIVSK